MRTSDCARDYWAVFSVAVSLAGCASSEPDVVATTKSLTPDGSLHPIRILPCQPGRYTGTFANVTGSDSTPTSTLNGTMSFSLIKVPTNSGEFIKVQNGAKLEGRSAQGDTFTADIDSNNGSCVAGQFNVKLINGLFWLPLPDSSPNNSLPFEGTVDGFYVGSGDASIDEQGEFTGHWRAYFPTYQPGATPFVYGGWTATWSGAN